jgi:hypothetical protein
VKPKVIFFLVAAMLAVIAGRMVLAQGDDVPLDPKIAIYDKGPTKIDVSKYPPEMQKTYKLFTAKCSHCHTIARPINSEFVLEDEWERYIKRMMRNAGTFIAPEEGKQIYAFLVYDAKTRKKALYDQKTKEAAGH